MGKLANKKRKLLRTLFIGCGITTAAFIFQACYGMPHDLRSDTYVYGVVTSKATGNPIQGIKVSFKDLPDYDSMTDAVGSFMIYVPPQDYLYLHFEDVDSMQYGAYSSKDTTIKTLDRREIELNVSLNEVE